MPAGLSASIPARPRIARRVSDRLRSLLLSTYHDSIVFRREIGMDPFGRLRPGNPIVSAHLLMIALLAALAPAWMMGGWRGLLFGSGAEIMVVALGAHPAAYRRAYLSLARERQTGTLEQLSMTLLAPKDIFEGKYYGALAPFMEARRYMPLLFAAFCASAWFALPGPAWLAAAAFCLAAMNHFGFGAGLGALGGIRAGLGRARLLRSLALDWGRNPWPMHLSLILKYALALALPCIFLAFLAWIAGGWAPLYPAAALLLLIPLLSGPALSAHQRAEAERMAMGFRLLLREDSAPGEDSR